MRSIAGCRFAAILLVASSVRGQFATTILQNPANVIVIAYDEARDRVIGLAGTTWEFDGAAWSTIGSQHFPDVGELQGVYDPSRQRTVVLNLTSGITWEWDGVDWMQGGVAPLRAFPPQTQIPVTGVWLYAWAYHAARNTVVMLVPNFTSNEVELWEWDGLSWTLVVSPPSAVPTTIAGPWSTYYYHSLAYDERSGQLVLFGRRDMLNQNTSDGITWLWNDVAGWTQVAQWSPVGETAMWFDRHRGRVMRHDTFNRPINPYTLQQFDGTSSTWVPTNFQGIQALRLGCYDSHRCRLYSTWGSWPPPFLYIYDTNPAAYDAHGAACATPTPPELSLTQPWTRAWLGDTLSVEATALPLSIALLAMGFSDQSYGTTALPLDLAPYGMPGCSLRVAPDAVLLASGSVSRASFQLPIPQAPVLLGTVYYQQVFAPAPGANALGMLASGSVRGTVGWK